MKIIKTTKRIIGDAKIISSGFHLGKALATPATPTVSAKFPYFQQLRMTSKIFLEHRYAITHNEQLGLCGMGKRPLEETQVVRKVRDEADRERRSAKKRRKVSEPDKGSASDGVETQEELRKKERKERKRLKKLEEKEHLHADKTMLGADDEGRDPVTGKTNGAIKVARKGRRAEMKAEGQSSHKTKEVPSISSSLAGASRAKSDIISIPESTNQSSVAAGPHGTTLKSGYVEDPSLAALPQSNIESFLSSNFITIDDPMEISPALRPITEFSYLPTSDHSQRAPFKSFSSPTPIQAAAWPFLLSGRDVIGVAETGSGKTLAFGVPCIRYISSLPKRERLKGPKAVIISPTRELALQIHEQLLRLATPAALEAVCVYGGVQKEEQRRALKSASIVVATPGRLNDFINEGEVDLGSIGYLVLDEADRMLDKGFEEDIKRIIRTTPPHGVRQTLMFTATWPQSVRELAATFMKAPVKISIGDNPNGELRANNRITQKVEVVDPRGKEARLLQLIKEHQSGKHKDDRILVFCLYKKEATRVENYLRIKGFRVAGIHGDLSQQQRTTSLEAFKSAKVPLLVATDVAARGLDIPAVKLVVNVTFPLTVEDYVHRIGRTGRAGQDGTAITLFTEHDKAQSGALINVLKAANQPVPDELLKFGTTVKKKGHDAYGAFYKETGSSKGATKIKFDD